MMVRRLSAAALAGLGLALLAAAPAAADTTEAQAALARLDCYDGPIDGKESRAMSRAIRCFERRHGDGRPDGALSDAEMQALRAAAAAAPDPAELQRKLGLVGCYDGPVDGRWSGKLRRGLRCFGAALGGEPDAAPAAAELAELDRTAAAIGDLASVQAALTRLGCYYGPEDGAPSAAVNRSVKCFERRTGRAVDGVLLAEDVAALRIAAEAEPAAVPAQDPAGPAAGAPVPRPAAPDAAAQADPAPAPAPAPDADADGPLSDDQLQRLRGSLNMMGCWPFSPRASFEEKIAEGVRCYQREVGLPEDGTADAALLRHMTNARMAEVREAVGARLRAERDARAAAQAEAQEAPLRAMRARLAEAGSFGEAPDLSADPAAAPLWTGFGLRVETASNTTFVTGVAPGGPAALAGIRPGAVIRGWGDGAFGARSLVGATLLGPDGAPLQILALVYRPQERGWDRQVHLLRAADRGAPPLPPQLAGLSGDAAFLALWRHETTAIDTPETAGAVARILYALSVHRAACYGPNPVEIPIAMTFTETRRNGLGAWLGEESETFLKTLRVRPEFEGAGRATAPWFSDMTWDGRFRAAIDLVSLDGCDGPRLRWLEEGIAKAAGVALPPAPPRDESLGADWRGFTAHCHAGTYPGESNSEAGAAMLCITLEMAAARVGDRALYDAAKFGGFGAYPSAEQGWDPDLIARLTTAFNEIWGGEGAPRDPEMQRRFDAYVRDMGY
ncbi:hypothetical protein ACQ5SO_07675 [Rhodovulum sp. DZ06]|uniref:hypothetical protein n=1 Tax=Rhodovulum sp. DZ06 TaxID=3425126 RepID=UPI003D3426D4